MLKPTLYKPINMIFKKLKVKVDLFDLFLLISLSLYVLVAIKFILYNPPIWPDEAIYADIAHNLISEFRLGTNLWGNTIPEVYNHAYWFPPIFFYLIAIWGKIFNLTITNLRLFPIIIGLIVLIVLYRYSTILLDPHTNKIIKKIFPSLILIALTADWLFMKSVRINRPEILVILFGLLSQYFYHIFWNSKSKKYHLIILSGLFSSFAILTHLIGVIFPLSISIFILFTKNIQFHKDKTIHLFLLSLFGPILIWLISIYPNYDILLQQVGLAILQKNDTSYWIITAFKSGSLPLKIAISGCILLTWEFLFYVVINKRINLLLIGITLAIAWFFAIFGKMIWYFVLPIPWVYLASFILLTDRQDQPKSKFNYKIIICVLLIVCFLSNVFQVKEDLGSNIDNHSYSLFSNQLLSVIPDNTTVLLSSIPDAYFSFQKYRNNKLYEFPVFHTDKNNYIVILNSVDYIIFNNKLGTAEFTNYLSEYIKLNSASITNIGNEGDYQGTIIKLKPRESRLQPQDKFIN